MMKWLNRRLAVGLTELSDINFQRDVWLAENPGNLISSWIEAVCGVYDDSGYALMREAGETCLGSELTSILDQLGDRIDSLGKDYWPKKSDIEGPIWTQIRVDAAHALSLLKVDPGYDWPPEIVYTSTGWVFDPGI